MGDIEKKENNSSIENAMIELIAHQEFNTFKN